MKLNGLEIAWVSGGRFRADGGAMFGVVPKVLWQKKAPPDEHNRVLLETNCLVVRTGRQTILIDSGYGNKASQTTQEHYALQTGHPLLENLARLGLSPDEITLVVLTHLHFDHVGGCTVRDMSGRTAPAFPKAKHLVQRAEWDDATSNPPELAGSYFAGDLIPLEEAGLVERLDGDAEILDGLRTRVTGGHTRGHQIVYCGRDDRQIIHLSDLCPSAAHLKTFWVAAYDIDPLTIRRVKPQILGEAADCGGLVLFGHDAESKGGPVRRDPKHEFVIDRAVKF
jgi:glyoxylase-like metal-dependent hydrolase (beta-lactamase superfamily II)